MKIDTWIDICTHNNTLRIRRVLRIFAEPVQAHYLSLKGFEQLMKTISKVQKKINPNLDIAGILITMADMRTNYSREIVELLRRMYRGKLRIFNSIIPLSIRAAETSAEGKSIYLHDPAGKVSAAYWTRTVVDHNGKDYYLVGYKDLPMDGLTVRVRDK